MLLLSIKTYAQTPPVVQNITPPAGWNKGDILITYELVDAAGESENATIAVKYSQDAATWIDATMGTEGDGLGSFAVTETPITKTYSWESGTDLANTEDTTVYIQITPTGDVNGVGTAVASADFQVDNKVPTNVGCNTPIHEATGVSITPTLVSLTAADGGSGLHATPYYIQIATNTAFTTGLQESGYDADGSWVPPTTLVGSTTYYWRVKARDALLNESAYCGNADNSTTVAYHSFTTMVYVPFFPKSAFILFGVLIVLTTVIYLRRKRALA